MLSVNRYVEGRTLYIQGEHEVLRPDDGLEHVKIFVGRLTIDRCLVEVAESMHDTLLDLAGGEYELEIWRGSVRPPEQGLASVSALGYREVGFIGKHGQNPKLV